MRELGMNPRSRWESLTDQFLWALDFQEERAGKHVRDVADVIEI